MVRAAEPLVKARALSLRTPDSDLRLGAALGARIGSDRIGIRAPDLRYREERVRPDPSKFAYLGDQIRISAPGRATLAWGRSRADLRPERPLIGKIFT